MTTIKDLMIRVGCNGDGISGSSSRVVLNHLGESLLGYGIGYGGFVAIFRTIRGACAASYSVKRTGWNTEGTFCEMPVIGNNYYGYSLRIFWNIASFIKS